MPIEWWVVIATVAGPILAVQTQKWIERAGERSKRRQWIFTALLANRATRLHDDYVKALNLIDLEFAPKRFGSAADRKVIEAWRSLFGNLAHAAPKDTADPAEMKVWNERSSELLVELLYVMSTAVGYTFGKEELRRGIYYPQGRVDLEQSQLAIMHGLAMIIQGRAALPMKITEIPVSEEAGKLQAALNEKMASAYDDDGALKVRMLPG